MLCTILYICIYIYTTYINISSLCNAKNPSTPSVKNPTITSIPHLNTSSTTRFARLHNPMLSHICTSRKWNGQILLIIPSSTTRRPQVLHCRPCCSWGYLWSMSGCLIWLLYESWLQIFSKFLGALRYSLTAFPGRANSHWGFIAPPCPPPSSLQE